MRGFLGGGGGGGGGGGECCFGGEWGKGNVWVCEKGGGKN